LASQPARTKSSCHIASQSTVARVPHPSQPHRDGRDVIRQAILIAALASALPTQAQQLIGYVSTKDADVTGASDVMDGHAVLSGAVAVAAKDHTAPITLGRGGAVRVCQTSIVHLTESKATSAASQLAAPLLLSLDRGAIEIQMNVSPTDAIMTADLRFAARAPGPLDLRLRVARNGDTCVENRGPQAPILAVTDPFGESLYEVLPNQHVLFEHGSLREVVDHETTPCGCPDSTGMSLAEALVAPGTGTGPSATAQTPATAPEHPFPTAISEGLAPEAEVPQAQTGQIHTQVSEALTYSAPPAAQSSTVPAPTPASTPTPQTLTPSTPSHNPFRAVGRFFRKLFSS